MVRGAREQGKCIKVIATETRPHLQGARLTAYELKEDGFDVTLIADTMVGYVMKKGLVDKVITGADRITKDGYVFNKIGTYQLSILAKRHEIPFFCAAPISSFDPDRTFDQVVIEERNVREITHIGRKRIAPKGVAIFNPAFDATPPDLISAIIANFGIIEPPIGENLSKKLRLGK